MSNSISDISSATLATSSAKLDGIQFNNIQKKGLDSSARYVLADTPWYTLDTTTSVKPAVNAVDIDWNAAVIPYGNLETGESVTVNSTGELLSLISRMQQEVHYTESDINSSPKNFYNDLVSNKKVYIGDNPVFYYKISGDTNAKTIVAYAFADHMGIPYALQYNIPITITSGSSDDTWECGEFAGQLLYNYFSPTVLIEVINNSNTYSSIDISVGNGVITIPIDVFVTYFLQSCDIFAKVKGDNTDTYWRLDGRNIGSVTSSINNSITRYMHLIDVNERYTVSITWDLNNKTLTTLATLIE